MQAIGGYFELADYETSTGFPHNEGILLNTGRNALEYILRSIGVIKRVYLPYYTCEVILEPLKKLQIPWVYYHINTSFEIVEDIIPKDGEYIIVNNYFGIKDAYIQALAGKYGDHLIVDCAQALFAKPLSVIKMFYSPRKYVGVADGGVAYLGGTSGRIVEVKGKECTADHDNHLYVRKQFGAEAGFEGFRVNETKLDNQPIRWMSETTKRILDHIDYDKVIARRRANFAFLYAALQENNSLLLPNFDSFVSPMVYPFISKTSRSLRQKLINEKVFVAKYWSNVNQLISYEIECKLADRVVAIPCDQRYGDEEMNRIVSIILSI